MLRVLVGEVGGYAVSVNVSTDVYFLEIKANAKYFQGDQ